MDPNWNNIPAEMREWDHWCYTDKDSKVPKNPRNGKNASPADTSTGASFIEACQVADRVGGNIGFIFSEQDPFCFVDLDTGHVTHPDQKRLNKVGKLTEHEVNKIVGDHYTAIDRLNSYTERSISGNSYHVFCYAKKADGSRCKDPVNEIEIYDRTRFAVITGDTGGAEYTRPLAHAQETIEYMINAIGFFKGHSLGAIDFDNDPEPMLSDDEVLDKLFDSLNGEMWEDVYRYNWFQYPRFRGFSEVDLALMQALMLVTGNWDVHKSNGHQAIRLFASSGLNRSRSATRKPDRDGDVKVKGAWLNGLDYFLRTAQASRIKLLNDPTQQTHEIWGIGTLVENAKRKAKSKALFMKVVGGIFRPSPIEEPTEEPEVVVESIQPPKIPDQSVPKKPIWSNAHIKNADLKSYPMPDFDLEIPDGLLKELTRYSFYTSKKPVPEMSLMCALAYIAPIISPMYDTPEGTAPNFYLMLVGNTGLGKDVTKRTFRTLNRKIRQNNNDINPNVIYAAGGHTAAGALLDDLQDHKHCVALYNEMGLRFSQLADENASGHEKELQGLLLTLHGESGYASYIPAKRYTSDEKTRSNQEDVGFSWFGETTYEIFRDLRPGHVSSGMLPRFIVYQCKKKRPYTQRGKMEPSEYLIGTLTALFEKRMWSMGDEDKCVPRQEPYSVPYIDSHAENRYIQLDGELDDRINNASNSVEADLLNRVGLNTIRLATLLAVSRDFKQPAIHTADLDWAYKFVSYHVEQLIAHFQEVGFGEGITKQLSELNKIVKSYGMMPKEDLKQIPDFLSDNRHLIPHTWIVLQMRVGSSLNKNRFKSELDNLLKVWLDEGEYAQVPRETVNALYENVPGVRPKLYIAV